MIDAKKFQRRVENFKCAACGFKVKGNGYTNHCPKCFVSKHVDNNPGDRKSTCGGLMLVKKIYFQQSTWHLIQVCELCNIEKHNKVQPSDDMEYLAKLNEQLIRAQTRG